MSLLKLKTKKGSNNFQTPDWPLESLLNHINSDLIPRSILNFEENTIFDPCCGKGNIVNFFTEQDYNIEGRDIENGYNFLTDPLPEGTTCIITNPPYSLKDQFLARCYEHGLPFALLLPITALEGVKRQAMYKEHGMQLLVLPKRVNYETPSGEGSGAWFHSDWFTHNFEFRKDMTFL